MATTLTRADLLEAISRELKLPRPQATRFLEFFIATMVDAIVEEEGLKIASFGSFKVRQKSKRIGRNPKTGKEATITPRRVLSFNPSLYLRKRVQLRKT